MQTHGGVAADQAITASDRAFRTAIYVDWDGTGSFTQYLGELSGYVSKISLEKSLKGSAPDDLLLIEGNSAAELTITLGGAYESSNLPNVFSRFNTKSPLFGYRTVGAPIKYYIIVDTPVGNFVYPQFVGTIRTIAPDRAANTVTITALDSVELLRKPVQTPFWAMSDISERWGELDSQVCWSHSIMDLALRLCDVGVAPKRPVTFYELDGKPNSNEGLQFWLTGNGTYIPTIGWLDNPNIDAFPNRGNAMYSDTGILHANAPAGSTPPQVFKGTGIANYGQSVPAQQNQEGFLRYWPSDRQKISSLGIYFFGMTLNDTAQAAAIPSSYQLFEFYGPWSRIYRIMIGGGKIWVTKTYTNTSGNTTTTTSGTINIPTDVATAEIYVAVDNSTSTGSRIVVKCGNNSIGWVAFGSNNAEYSYYEGNFNILGRITVNNIVDLSDVFLSVRENPASRTTVYQPWQCYKLCSNVAVLDRGLNRFSHMPEDKPVEAWQMITDIAAAEQGSVFFDENGVFRFWNRETIDAKQLVPVRRVSLDDLSSLQWTDNIDSVRNIYNVTASRKRAIFQNDVYQATDINQFMTPAKQTKTFRVWVGEMVSPLTWRMGRYSGQGGNGAPPKFDTGLHGYIVQYDHGASNGGWWEENVNTNPIVTCGFDGDGWLVVRVDNQASLPIRFAKGQNNEARADDSPAFNIRGTKIEDFGEQAYVTRNDASIAMYGPKTYDVSGAWVQDSFNASNMTAVLMARTAAPIPTTDDITIPCDPRLQLGDALLLDDASGMGPNIGVQILGIHTEWSLDEPFVSTLTVECVRPPSVSNKTTVPPITTLRRNTNPNPSLLNDATGWYGGNRVTNAPFPRASTGYYASNKVITPQAAVVTPGQNHTYSVWTAPYFSGTMTVELQWYADGEYYSRGGVRKIPVAANNLTQLSITAPAPNLADTALLVITYSGNAVFAQAMMEQATSVNPGQVVATNPLEFFDGNTAPPATSWDGTAGNSSSTYQM